MSIINITDLDLNQKRVLIRVDMNVPQNEDGSISDDTRIRASLPTIQYALQQGAAVILMTHLGRPTEGGIIDHSKENKPKNVSLAPIAKRLAELLKTELQGMPVPLISGYMLPPSVFGTYEDNPPIHNDSSSKKRKSLQAPLTAENSIFNQHSVIGASKNEKCRLIMLENIRSNLGEKKNIDD